jgi:ribonucleoside-diphosphate reductase alpha chain
MYVNKRNGKKETIKFDKVTARIEKLSYSLSPLVNPIDVAKKVIEGFTMVCLPLSWTTSRQKQLHRWLPKHPDYAILASRIAVSNLHKNTVKSFSKR